MDSKYLRRVFLRSTYKEDGLFYASWDKVRNYDTEYLTLEEHQSRTKVLVDALRFYAGERFSNIETDVFDHFKCDCGTTARKEFDHEWLCERAREALKQFEGLDETD